MELEWEVRDLLDETKGSLKDELEDFLGILEDVQLEELDEESFDILEVIDKYKDGRIKDGEAESKPQVDNSWRKMIPQILKSRVKDWATMDIYTFYDQAKSLKELDRKTIIPFLAELSQIVFDESEHDETTESDEMELVDGIADSIMSLVEMIILPHLEVLDIIQQRGGRITFGNIWNKPLRNK